MMTSYEKQGAAVVSMMSWQEVIKTIMQSHTIGVEPLCVLTVERAVATWKQFSLS